MLPVLAAQEAAEGNAGAAPAAPPEETPNAGPGRRRPHARPGQGDASKADAKKPGEKKPEKPRVPFETQFEKAGASDPIYISQDECITRDRMYLVANYFKGGASEETVPVILLHNFGASKEEMMPLAQTLAAAGMAVLVPDLRGHGESTFRAVMDFSSGDRPTVRREGDYTYDKFDPDELAKINSIDGPFWYAFLVNQHNQKRLNLRKLILIGNQSGGFVASSWAAIDWSAPSSRKGRFVKGLILFSPDSQECLPPLERLKGEKPGDSLGLLVLLGEISRDKLTSAKEIQKEFGGKEADVAPDDKKAMVASFKTEAQGIALVDAKNFKIDELITRFIDHRLGKIKSRDAQWTVIKTED